MSTSEGRLSLGLIGGELCESESRFHEVNGHNASVTKNFKSIYGEVVDAADYPYVVPIYSNQDSYNCAGSIVSQRLVLTAAHCCKRAYYVKVLDNEWQIYYVQQKVTYPSTKRMFGSSVVQDIALLVLDESIQNAQLVKLPETNLQVPEGVIAYAYGWGETEDGSLSEDLRKVDLEITYGYPCTRYESKNDAHWICTKSLTQATCYGDSGGPLLWEGYIVGITSRHIGNGCLSSIPSLKVRVAPYRQWIDYYIDIQYFLVRFIFQEKFLSSVFSFELLEEWKFHVYDINSLQSKLLR
ncbi:hypothetical protein QAD02_010716 [Eretmocerus hayati]|uniref:Uncharacterized protein n=1 Tax=Eretmocerus hayati TaxID=131215 RepID=A0ACC2NUR7_9HYME|nr:hypothetical protein QAD02_010716 [Eretmocerus hayati]